MVAAFSAPILSVAADAVRDLEGHDALFGLWTVFTKCKTSLPNGARLENITWRLWHCELKGPVLRTSSRITKEGDTAEVIRPLEKSPYRPPPPSASTTIFPTHTSPADPTQYSTVSEDVVYSSPEAYGSPFYSPSCLPENATRAASNSSRRRRSSRAVGRIVCDFLPTNPNHVDQPSPVDHPADVSPATIYQSIPKTAFGACGAKCPSTITFSAVQTLSCLPTPDTPEMEPSITRTATQSPSQLLTVGPAADPTPGLLSEPPRLVVVKPTPNPTPQPTPPTTPLDRTTVTAMQSTRSLWLTPLRLASDSVTQPRYERETAVGIPDHANIWTQPMRDRDLCHDHADGLSASSIASEYSQTTNSVAGASTTSASSTGYLHDEREKPSHLIGNSMVYTHVVGNLPLPTLQRPVSLSTIQSTSTDQGRKEAVPSSDVGDEMRDGSSGMVTAAEEDDEQEVVYGKGKRLTRSRSTFSSRKRAKRNSAPVSLTPIPCSHVDQTPHHSLAVPISTEHPTTTEPTSERLTNSNAVMDHVASNPSQSRSRESSANGSRSRSREPSGNPFADLSGIGTLGGYTIAAAYPPPNMTVRKQVVVGAGKGKIKLGFGRGNSGKSKVVRRNSAGSATDVGGKEKDKGGSGSSAKLERVKSEENKQSRLEDILEKPTLDQRIEELPQVPLKLEEMVSHALMPTAAAEQRNSASTYAQPKQFNEFLSIGEHIQSVRRQARFNIGSNSDDGSGVASKGSSQTGGQSFGQQVGRMMVEEGRVVNEKMLDTLLLQEQDRQRQDGVKNETQRLGGHQLKLPNTHAEILRPTVPQKPTKHEIRLEKAALPPHNALLGRVQSSSRVSEKGKGRPNALDHHAMPAPTTKPSSKTKSKSTPNLGSLDAVLAAKVRDSLGEPLLPKGRTVVVDTDSEYETETEDGWSDEELIDEAQKRINQELTLQRDRERQVAELQEQELLLQQIYLQQQLLPNHQHHGGRPTGVQRTHSSHFPAPNNARTNKGPAQRHRHQQIRELALHHAKLEQAAKEAQRQREMIQKLPMESFQDLAKARANSVGLLTQLLNPNPGVLPSNPHKRGHSSGALAMQLAPSDPGPSANSNTVGGVPPNNLPQQSTHAPEAELTRPLAPRRHASTDEGRRRMSSLSKVTSPIRGPPLKLTKSSAALPVSSHVQAGRVMANGGPSATISSSRILGIIPTSTGSGGYRPKGPPKGQEMDDDSDSEPDTEKIQISKSIAEQRLKSLAEKRGVRYHQPHPAAGPSRVAPPLPGDEDVPDWARVSQPHRQQEYQRRPASGLQITPLVHPPPSVPIPLGHPYNLPLPAPPTTPRTTRRQMLSTELSESLRRNLLWERQVSKNNLAAAMRRSSSGGVNHHDGLGRLQPFTTIAPVVQLHAKGTIPLDQQEDPAKRAGGPVTEAEREVMRKHAVARNRSWANEFHYAGW